MKRYKIDIPIYNCTLEIVLAKNFEKAVREANYHGDIGDATAITLRYPETPQHYVIVFDKKNISAGIIAHESAHVVRAIYLDLGIKYDLNNDEPFCYLLQFVTECISKSLVTS